VNPSNFLVETNIEGVILKNRRLPKARINNGFRSSMTADRSDCMGTLLGTPRIGPEKTRNTCSPSLGAHARQEAASVAA
jgi:hypothetical protein